VQHELGGSITGAAFTFQTQSMAGQQTAVDGGANDADGASNGSIVVTAATMAGFGANTCDTWTSAVVTKAGYVNDNVAMTSPGGGGGGCGGPIERYRTTRPNVGTSNNAFTVRVVLADDQFGNAVSMASGNTAFSGLTLTDPAAFNGTTAYLPASPAAPAVLTLARTGFITVATTAAVAPNATFQTPIRFGSGGGVQGPALRYNVVVTAQDELGNTLTLSSITTSMSGLTLAAAIRYFGGSGYVPADPAAPAKLTLSNTGYVNTQTTANVVPSSTVVQTVLFRPTAGQAPGLPFSVLVRAWDEINSRKLNLASANTAFGGGLSMNGTIRYSDSSAYIPLTATAVLHMTHVGYLDAATTGGVIPVAAKQDTVDFRPGAGHSGPGLVFSLRLRIKDASGANLDGARVDILDGSEARVKDVNGDSVWTTAEPSGAADGYAYIPLDQTDDDNATLAIRVQHASYLTDVTTHLLNEVNASYQIQRQLQMGSQLAAPSLRSPSSGETVATLRPTLKWTGGAGADSFEVQLNTRKDFSAAGLDTGVTPDSVAVTKSLVDKTIYYWRVRAKGMGGTTGPFGDVWSFRVSLDDVLPVVVLPAPAKDSLFRGTLAVKFDATDNDVLVSREISVDGGAFAATTTDSTFTWNTALYPDGTHSLQVRATDRGGNVGYSAIVQVRLQNAPAVTVPAPSKDSLLTGTSIIKFTATSRDSIVSRDISIDGGAYVATSSESTYAWNTKAYSDGVHTVLVRAKDRGNNIGLSRHVDFRVDNSPPMLGVLTLRYEGAAPMARKGASALLRIQASDPAGMSADSAVLLSSPALDSAHRMTLLRDDGADGDLSAGDGVFSAVVPLSADSAQFAFTVRARDRLDHDTTVTGTFRLDLNAPQVAYGFEPAPANGSDGRHGEVYADKIVLKGKVSDAGGSGLASLKITVTNDSGAPVQSSPLSLPPQAGDFSAVLGLVPGNNHVTVVAADSAGNATSVSAVLDFVDPKATGLVAAGGGQVFTADGTGVVVGKDATQGPLQVTIRRVAPSEEPKPRDSHLHLLGVAREFGPDKTVFRRPVSLTLTYTGADLDPNQDGILDFDPKKLIVVFWDGQGWARAGEPTVDANKRTVTVSVNHFTLFDLAQSDAADSTNLIAYWSRNPFRRDQGTVFNYSLPSSGKVSLHILDLAGDVVREIIPKGTQRGQGQWSEVWRGENVSDRFAGVGLYVYVFKYDSDDNKVRKIIRLPIGVGK
jgi:hypothetical protein